MRCIEIYLENDTDKIKQINRNMRCIEMNYYSAGMGGMAEINRNMRCIEIKMIRRVEYEKT